VLPNFYQGIGWREHIAAYWVRKMAPVTLWFWWEAVSFVLAWEGKISSWPFVCITVMQRMHYLSERTQRKCSD